jgi:hypothetical protein
MGLIDEELQRELWRARILPRKQWLFLALGFAVATALIAMIAPYGIDWSNTYRPVCWLVLTGHSPYENHWFYNPPWALIPLIPLALLPEAIGRGLLFSISLIILFYVLRKRGASRISLLAFLLSPPGIGLVYGGNIDAIAMLGFILPPPIAIFFLAIKPQVGIGLMIYWFVTYLIERDYRQIVRVFGPLSVAILISILAFPRWIDEGNHLAANSSLWPWSLVLGLVALAHAINRRRSGYAIAAGPALSPYLSFQTWSTPLVALAPHSLEMVAASIGLWLLVVVHSLMT